MGSTQAAANALSNLAKAAVGLGFAGSALSMSMYNGTCATWEKSLEFFRARRFLASPPRFDLIFRARYVSDL